jgi:hypothetical protein
MPIGHDYTLIDHSITELSVMGVDSIWIVCPDESIAAIRNVVGENVLDPICLFWGTKEGRVSSVAQNLKVIPIYYVPLHLSDQSYRRASRNYPLWYITYGIYVAAHLMRRISNWVVPASYQVAFPYGIYPMVHYFFQDQRELNTLRSVVHRLKSHSISERVRMFSFTHKDKHITNDAPLGLMIDDYLFEMMRQYIASFGYHIDSKYLEEVRKELNVQLPSPRIRHKRNIPRAAVQGRLMRDLTPDLNELFTKNTAENIRAVSLSEFFGLFSSYFYTADAQTEEVKHFHEIKNWDSYRRYLAFMEKHKNENENREFFDTRPNFQKSLKLGRVGWHGVGHDLTHQDWEEIFANPF